MDAMEDEDIFGESMELSPRSSALAEIQPDWSVERNPVEEHLLKQLSEADERIESTKSEIEETRMLKEKILRRFFARAFNGESASSDSDSELYTVSGEPIMKRKRMQRRVKKQPLMLIDVWHRVAVDKWVVGVVLQNLSDRTLHDLDVFLKIKNQQEVHGIATFWVKRDDKFWTTTNIIEPEEEVVSTVALDLPNFSKISTVELIATISYEQDGKQLQTVVPKVQLKVEDTIQSNHALKFEEDNSEIAYEILAVKAMSMERNFGVKDLQKPIQSLKEILTDMGFLEVTPKVFAGLHGSLEYSILEVRPVSSTECNVTAYIRSTSQLNIIMHLLHGGFPEKTIIKYKSIAHDDALQALERELELYLTPGTTHEQRRAQVVTDLLFDELKKDTMVCQENHDLGE